MPIQATNNFVFIKRDDPEREASGLILPESSLEQPSKGTIVTVGDVVHDKKIKSAKGRQCIFPKGVGFPIEHDGIEYLVLEAERIFAIV